jgi:hypothetical protein
MVYTTLTLSSAQTDLQTSTAKIYGYQVLLGIGLGAYLQSGYAVIQSILPPSDLAYAVSFTLTGICTLSRFHLIF